MCVCVCVCVCVSITFNMVLVPQIFSETSQPVKTRWKILKVH